MSRRGRSWGRQWLAAGLLRRIPACWRTDLCAGALAIIQAGALSGGHELPRQREPQCKCPGVPGGRVLGQEGVEGPLGALSLRLKARVASGCGLWQERSPWSTSGELATQQTNVPLSAGQTLGVRLHAAPVRSQGDRRPRGCPAEPAWWPVHPQGPA